MTVFELGKSVSPLNFEKWPVPLYKVNVLSIVSIMVNISLID